VRISPCQQCPPYAGAESPSGRFVEPGGTRQVRNDYTFPWEGELYQIEPAGIVSGLRGSTVRVEKRLDGSLAARYRDRYLPIKPCAPPEKKAVVVRVPPQRSRQARPGSDWNRNFDFKKAPKIWQAAQESGHRSGRGD
jgi:hypothetical protein